MVKNKTLLFFLFSFFLFSIAEAETSPVEINYYQNGESKTGEITLLQKELLTVEYVVSTDEEFAYLSLDSDRVKIAGFLLETYTNTRLSEKAVNGRYLKRFYFYLWPISESSPAQKTNTIEANLPSVHLRLSGRNIETITHKITLNVKQLPAYLTPDTTVGNITLSDRIISDSLIPGTVQPNQVLYYTLVSHSSGVHQSMLPDFQDLLLSPSIKFLPVSDLSYKVTDPVRYNLVHKTTWPLTINTIGIFQFSPIRLLNINPGTSKLESAYFQPRYFFSTGTLFTAIFFILSSIVIYWLMRKLLRYYKRVLKIRNYWKRVSQSADIESLINNVKKLPLSINELDLARNMTLSEWSKQWNSSRLTELTHVLNQLRFSQADRNEVNSIKHKLLEELKRHHRLHYYCFTATVA